MVVSPRVGSAAITVEDFSRIVSGIYAAAVAQEWEPVTRDVMGALDATGGGLVVADGSSRWQVGAILAPEAAKSYAEHYSGLDHVLAAVEQGPVGLVRAGDELISAKPDTEFHADWIRPNRLEDGLFVRLNSGTPTSCFVASSPRDSESFATPERIKLMSGLVAHLRQALRTQNKLAALAQRSTGLLGAVEAVRHGVIIVESGYGVIHVNTAAERIVRAGDGIGIRSGRIATGSTQTERRLNGALHAGPRRRRQCSLRLLVHLRTTLRQTALRHSRAATSPVRIRRSTQRCDRPGAGHGPRARKPARPSTVAPALQFHQRGSRNRSPSYSRRRPQTNLRRVVGLTMDSSHPLKAPIRQDRHTPPSRTRPTPARRKPMRTLHVA